MIKTELFTDVTLENLIMLNETLGMTVEVNDGQVTGVNFSD